MNAVVTFLWEGTRGYAPRHVDLLGAQVARHSDCRFVCVTDYPAEAFSELVDVVRPPEREWQALRKLRTLEGPAFPSSYPRLLGLSRWATSLSERILVLDVDCLVVDRLDGFFARDEPFVGWRPRSTWGRSPRFGGGTWFHRTGTQTDVFDAFLADPVGTMRRAKLAGYRGSDQALLSLWFADRAPAWTAADGIYEAQDGVFSWTELPANARIVHMNGCREKPWSSKKQWVRDAICGN